MWGKFNYIIIGVLLLAGCLSASAQGDNMQRAQQLYQFAVAGQGDSIHARMEEKIREKIVPQVFAGAFQSLEKQYGKCQATGEWQSQTAAGSTIYFCDVKFERYELRFQTSFNDKGEATMILFIPVPPKNITSPVLLDNDTVKEKPIEVHTGDFRLPGTLTYPKKIKNFPVLILVHGSGPNDRDETYGPNKPFRDLAWGLAAQGVAVIRYDKRTKVYGALSAPQGKELTLNEEVIDDALAAVQLAKTIPGADPKRIFVLGHSLGGLVAPLIAERAGSEMAGITLLAAPARKFEKLVEEQYTYLGSLTNASTDPKTMTEELMKTIPEAYLRMLDEYNPVETARQLKIPILILQGERDYQVTMEDFGLWRFGLFRNSNVQFQSYPKLNHLLQEGSGKSTPYEYDHAAPVPKYVMDDVAAFIKGVK